MIMTYVGRTWLGGYKYREYNGDKTYVSWKPLEPSKVSRRIRIWVDVNGLKYWRYNSDWTEMGPGASFESRYNCLGAEEHPTVGEIFPVKIIGVMTGILRVGGKILSPDVLIEINGPNIYSLKLEAPKENLYVV